MKQPLFLLLFAIATVIGLTWINDLWQIKNQYESIKSTEKISYYLTNFSLLVTDKNGNKTYSLKANHLSHWRQKNVSEIIAPKIVIPDKQSDDVINVTANKLFIDKKNKAFELVGQVNIKKNTPKETVFRLTTEKLQLYPKKKQLKTDVAVKIETPTTILTGVGMTGDLNTTNLRIHSNVRATINLQKH